MCTRIWCVGGVRKGEAALRKWDWNMIRRPQSELCFGVSGIEIKCSE